MQKVQGSVSGRKIKRNTSSSAVWNTERKYNISTYITHTTLHIWHWYRWWGDFFRLIHYHLYVNTWWGWWGPWYCKRSYCKLFGKLLSYDRHRFRLCSCRAARRHVRPTLTTLTLINLCMAWLLMNLYGNSRCRGELKHHLWWRDEETANAWKLFIHIPKA